MARLHLGALEFSEADSGYPQPHWHESRLLREDMESLGARLSPAIRRNVADIIDELRHEPMTPDSYGLIHREVSINNRHLEEGRAWIFDFGNCECGYFLQDLATVLYDSIDCNVRNQFADPGHQTGCRRRWRRFLPAMRKLERRRI